MKLRAALLCATLVLTAASDDSDFSRVVRALAQGGNARHSSTTAGQALLASGAHPLDGEDVGVRWARGQGAAYRNRALGPGYRALAVPAGATLHFQQTFLAGQQAQVAIVPLGKARFALVISGDDGQPACTTSAAIRCDWTPPWTTRYRIDVRNTGPTAGRSFLVIQ